MEPIIALDWYFKLADEVARCVKTKRSLAMETLGYSLSPGKSAVYQQLLNDLNRCTIFQIDWKSLAGMRTAQALFSETEEEARRSLEGIFTLPYPTERMFVGFKGAEYIRPVQSNPTRVVGMFLSPKNILTLNETFVTQKEMNEYTVISLLEDGQWTYSRRRRRALEIRINLLKMAIQVINDHTTVTVALDTQAPSFRSYSKHDTVKQPEAIHLITLQKKVRYVSSDQPRHESQEDDLQETSKKHHARGHPAVRIRKESLPINPKTLKDLRRDRRRKIFLDRSDIDDDSWDTLRTRDITVGDHEWVAILKYWVSETKADPTEPSVPTVYVQKSPT